MAPMRTDQRSTMQGAHQPVSSIIGFRPWIIPCLYRRPRHLPSTMKRNTMAMDGLAPSYSERVKGRDSMGVTPTFSPHIQRHEKSALKGTPDNRQRKMVSRFDTLNMEDWKENLEEVVVEMTDLGDQLKSIPNPTTRVVFTGSTYDPGEASDPNPNIALNPRRKPQLFSKLNPKLSNILA